MGLFSFFRGASDYINPDPSAIDRSHDEERRHTTYHKRIVWISVACGMVGVIIGIVASATLLESNERARGILMAPFLFGAAGLLLGAAIACLFAPREFLTGPLGEKWMNLIGTKSVLVARIICLIFGLLVAGFLTGMAILTTFIK